MEKYEITFRSILLLSSLRVLVVGPDYGRRMANITAALQIVLAIQTNAYASITHLPKPVFQTKGKQKVVQKLYLRAIAAEWIQSLPEFDQIFPDDEIVAVNSNAFKDKWVALNTPDNPQSKKFWKRVKTNNIITKQPFFTHEEGKRPRKQSSSKKSPLQRKLERRRRFW